MDPNVCYEQFLWAINHGQDRKMTDDELNTAKEKHAELLAWLNNGGFEPDWSMHEKRLFLRHEF